MQIALLHKHYSADHLDSVKSEMTKRGAPVIRATWSDVYGMWMAFEGCHRIRAAKALGLTPVIKNIGDQKYTRIQQDGGSKTVNVAKFAAEMEADLYKAEYITFDDNNNDDE